MNKRILCLALAGLICVGGINSKSYANEKKEIAPIRLQESRSQNGWISQSGQWYYYQNGVIQKGWKQVGGQWYYLNEKGIMQNGWIKLSDKWYYLKSDGAMATGWLNLSGTWYYLEGNGAMSTGWKQLGAKWYYLNNSGAMQKGWQQIQGSWYYLYGSGEMATNITIDGWKINSSGVANPINNQKDEYSSTILYKEINVVNTYTSSMNTMLKQGWIYAVSYAGSVNDTLVDVYDFHLSINSNSEIYNEMTSVLYNMSMYNYSVANGDYNNAMAWLEKLSNSCDKVGSMLPRNARTKKVDIDKIDLDLNDKSVDPEIIKKEVEKILNIDF